MFIQEKNMAYSQFLNISKVNSWTLVTSEDIWNAFASYPRSSCQGMEYVFGQKTLLGKMANFPLSGGGAHFRR